MILIMFYFSNKIKTITLYAYKINFNLVKSHKLFVKFVIKVIIVVSLKQASRSNQSLGPTNILSLVYKRLTHGQAPKLTESVSTRILFVRLSCYRINTASNLQLLVTRNSFYSLSCSFTV